MADNPNETVPIQTGSNRLMRNIGFALILLSGVFFFSMLSVPLWPVSTASRAIIGGTLFVGMQIAWWTGAAMVGPAAVGKMMKMFRRKQER